MDEDIKRILQEQEAKITQRFADNQKALEAELDKEISLDEWVGVNSSDGKGIVRNSDGTYRKGEIVTSGQILAGENVLSLASGLNNLTINSMPTNYKDKKKRKYFYPKITPGKIAILAEITYEGDTIPCSCVPSLQLPLVYTRSISYLPIAYTQPETYLPMVLESYSALEGECPMLWATFEPKNSFPEEYCKCTFWFPETNSNGSIYCREGQCSSNGGFASEQDCLNFPRGNNIGGIWTAIQMPNQENFIVGDPRSFPINPDFYFPDILVIKANNNKKIIDYAPNYLDDNLGRFITEDDEQLSWLEVKIFRVNGYIRFYQNFVWGLIGNVGSGGNLGARNPWPLTQQISNLWDTPNIHGWVVQRRDISTRDSMGNVPSGWQPYAIGFREFGYWIGQYTFTPLSSSGINFGSGFNNQMQPSNNSGEGSHPYHIMKIWLCGDRETPIKIWEGLARREENRLVSDEILVKFGMAHTEVTAYLAAFKDLRVVVVKHGITKKYKSIEAYPFYEIYYEWCKITVVSIEGDLITSNQEYSNGEEIYIPDFCLYKNLYKQWVLKSPYDSGYFLSDSRDFIDRNQQTLNTALLKYVYDYTSTKEREPQPTDRNYQGKQIAMFPYFYNLCIPKIGCNFWFQDEELWAAFLKLDEWANDNILIDNLEVQNLASGTVVVGKVQSPPLNNILNGRESACYLQETSIKVIPTNLKVNIPESEGKRYFIEACPFPKESSLASATSSVPANLIRSNFSRDEGDYLMPIGSYTWAENNLVSGQKIIRNGITYYKSTEVFSWGYYPESPLGNLIFLGCNGQQNGVIPDPGSTLRHVGESGGNKPIIIGKC